jgi:alkanesulfonate monooxygenase SsuD/methylene tetrahydromethanopterin reductase-like flavin-dependent oxidoreductase (luciferase family)
MAALEIGVQFWPWNAIRQLVAWGAQALQQHPFSRIWVCDEFQYEDCLTTLTAMAMELPVSLGSMVTFPWRNPLDLAQRFASIAKLTRDGREVAIGIGAGGSVQVQVIGEKRNPLAVMEESVVLLRALLAGQAVELKRFPELGGRFRYNAATRARLYFPPPRPVPVYLAAGGPRMLEVAGRHADGVIFSQIVARTSRAGMERGLWRTPRGRSRRRRATVAAAPGSRSSTTSTSRSRGTATGPGSGRSGTPRTAWRAPTSATRRS